MCGHKSFLPLVIYFTLKPPMLSPFSRAGLFDLLPPIIYYKMSSSVIISFYLGGVCFCLLSSTIYCCWFGEGDYLLPFLFFFLGGYITIKSGTELDFCSSIDFCIELCFLEF